MPPHKPSKKRGVLSSSNINEEMRDGNVLIYPFRAEQLQNTMYDVRLGESYFRNSEAIPFFNPWSSDHVADFWGEPLLADVATESNAREMGLNPGDRYILLAPGEYILAHTEEFIGGRNFITSKMQARSSMGRSFISVCMCAGQGDIGFTNRWCMEIKNHTTSPVVLPVGACVAQIIFYYSSVPIKPYQGKYQSTPDMEKLMNEWKPTDLLGKAYKDKKSIASNRPIGIGVPQLIELIQDLNQGKETPLPSPELTAKVIIDQTEPDNTIFDAVIDPNEQINPVQ
jgi:dCTP deaminase